MAGHCLAPACCNSCLAQAFQGLSEIPEHLPQALEISWCPRAGLQRGRQCCWHASPEQLLGAAARQNELKSLSPGG